MSIYVLANWKAHKTLSEATAWLEKFSRLYRPHSGLEVIIAPPTPYLFPLAEQLRQMGSKGLSLAAQDLSPFPLGAYTGAVAAAMVRDVVDYAILGHVERRRYFHETIQEVANKAAEASAVGIRPIVCMNRPHARSQMAALQEEGHADLMIGYRPIEAIGIDIPQSPEAAAEVVRQLLDIAPGRPVLYGGSLNADNAEAYLKIEGVAGLMVGTASLEAEAFARICDLAATR